MFSLQQKNEISQKTSVLRKKYRKPRKKSIVPPFSIDRDGKMMYNKRREFKES